MVISSDFLFLNLCFLFCYFISISSAGNCNFKVKLKQALRNEGLHRNITYGIVFNADNDRERWLYQDCIVALDQTLPRGVYANPDELNDLRRVDRLNAIPKNKINVELPAEDSEASSVYVIGRVAASKVYLWLPVHARYHRAQAGGGTALNAIPPPKLFLRCPDQRLDTCSKGLTLSTFLCNGSSKEKCSWKEIPYSLMSTPITWQVPVGNTDHYYLVAGGTSAIVLIGSLYLIRTIHLYKLSERLKKQY